MGCNKKKKAFTLTELLVVVIVLGVLAGVAAPKFKRVLETRKTTEAENMLAAVRTEQEKRCIMGKNYRGVGEESKLDALANASTSANYTYSLTNAGVSATSKGASNAYTIKMLSYKNGTLCCDGDGCAALNKSYVSCSSVTIPDDECSAENGNSAVVEPEPTPSCNEDEKDESPQPQVSGNMECLVARKATCENGTWVYQNLGIMHPTCHCINTCEENETLNPTNCTCEAKSVECEGDPEVNGTTYIGIATCARHRTATCNKQTGQYEYTQWEIDYSNCTCNKKCASYNAQTGRCELPDCGDEYWYKLNTSTCECDCACADRPQSSYCSVKTTETDPLRPAEHTVISHNGTYAAKSLTCTKDTGCKWKATCEYSALVWQEYHDGSVQQTTCFTNPSEFKGPGYSCSVEGFIQNTCIGSDCGRNNNSNPFDDVGCSGGSGGSQNSMTTHCSNQKYQCTRTTKSATVFQIGSSIWSNDGL